jgi:hypothetical protein
MHRALLALAALLLAAPAAQAAVSGFSSQADVTAGGRLAWPIEAGDGDALLLDWSAGSPVDVFVVQGDNASVLDDANSTAAVAFSALNEPSGRGHVTLAAAGPWLLVVDNSASQAGGGNGTSATTVTVEVAPSILEVPPSGGEPAPAGGSGDGEAPTLWNTLLFDAWKWVPGDAVAFGGVALWALVVLVAACIGFHAPLRPTALLAAAVAGFVLLWSIVPLLGPMMEIGLCAAAGLAVAWWASRQVQPTWGVLRVVLVATILGTFAGDVLAWALKHAWSDPGMLYFGNRRFVDELFTVPGFGVLGFVLFKVIPEIVHAQETDDEHASQARGPMQADVFQVRCLRCQTDIKVDRSMKRFRVATDRFEFACPNCQYWMEWADPNAKGSAAA